MLSGARHLWFSAFWLDNENSLWRDFWNACRPTQIWVPLCCHLGLRSQRRKLLHSPQNLTTTSSHNETTADPHQKKVTKGTQGQRKWAKLQLKTIKLTELPTPPPACGLAYAHLCTRPHVQPNLHREAQAQEDNDKGILPINYRRKQVLRIKFGAVENTKQWNSHFRGNS